MKIDFSKWKTFLFTEVFIIKKGFYNKKPEESGNGTIPFLGATDKNNGVTAYYTKDEINSSSKTGSLPNDTINKKIFPGKSVCVTNNGSVGYAYYQETEFTCSHDVNPLYRKDGEFNYFTGLFVASIIMKDRYRWGYGRKWRPERMVKSKINLPATNEGKPDWDWMERFMKSLKHKPIKTGNNKKSSNVNASTWKEFYLHKLFNTSMGNGIDAIATTNDNPKFNYVSRDSNGNGVVGFVDEVEGQKPFPAGAMSLALGGSFLGSCFIQKEPFYTAQNVGILQEKEPLSIHTKLFISTLIRNECKIKYQAFGRELNSHFKKDFTIKLPVLMNGNDYVFDKNKKYSDKGYVPDWKFMENYIKSLPYGDRIDDFREDVSYEY
ncbi:restriction endonuclease subunit S [Sneathia sanguinegens]|uniref:restriction endonuclease subunit S n=1 Tax=Sneathia sanguinegens TaxID=40543 RepID=UPI00288B88BE|nr:restriction endonuclease subunit S [Sneathia sanguinegens]